MNYEQKQKQETNKLLNYLREGFSYPSKQDIKNTYLQSGMKEAQYLLYNTALSNDIDPLVIDTYKLVLNIYYGNV